MFSHNGLLIGSENYSGKRKLSYNLRKTTSELYSAVEGQSLSDIDYSKIIQEVETIKKYPVYYVESSGNIDEVRETVLKFSENEGKGKWIIIMIDHILLTKGRSGETEREIVSKLQYMLMEIKKWPIPITVIQLSQLNRDIESVDRITNSSMHYPTRKDLFGSDKYKIVRVKFGEFRETPEMDNSDPSSENSIKISEKEQRLTGEELTNKPDTSAEQLGFDPNEKDIYGKSFNDYCSIAQENFINSHYKVDDIV